MDSLLPPEEALRRFREGLPVVAGLAGGAPSRDSLVRLFVGAVGRRDAALVNRLIVSRAEFAHLYYPSSPLREPPEAEMRRCWDVDDDVTREVLNGARELRELVEPPPRVPLPDSR